MAMTLEKTDGAPAAARKDKSLTFEVRPTSNPTSDKDRAAKLVDPGFGRVFTDHMAIVQYNQTKGWHGARVESRANFPLDPALAVLHYAQEIFEGLKAYKRDDGGVNLFRPDANARRFWNSAERMAMAPIPALPPWLNGAAARLAPSAFTVVSCAIRPSATMARRFFISAMVGFRKTRQVLTSAGVGLFSGGTQRTPLVMRASTSSRPSSGRASNVPREKPYSFSVA